MRTHPHSYFSHGGATMLRSDRRRVSGLALAFLIAPSVAAALDWPMYGRDLRHSFSNSDSLINTGNVVTLLPGWDFTTGDAVSASPAVVDGVVYIGSWDGFFYALNAMTGALKWQYGPICPTPESGITPIPAGCPGGPSAPQDRATTD